jgi:hypothetical protein
MCCRILVTLVVPAVPVASPLLMLPLIIATFSGFKLRGWGAVWTETESELLLVPAPLFDIFTWHEENSNGLKGIEILVCVCVCGGGGVVACASTIQCNIVYLYVLKERFSVRHTEYGGATVCIGFTYVRGRFTHSMPCPCRAHAVPLPCRVANGLECVFPIWFTQCGRVWFTLAMPRPCHALATSFFSLDGRAVPWPEKNGMVRAWHGRGMGMAWKVWIKHGRTV